MECKMDDSILLTVKDQIGIDRKNTDFDKDLIICINPILFILYQEGLTQENYEIMDDTMTWADILLEERSKEALNVMVKWVGLRTRLLFDPPTSSVLLQALKDNAAELEWRAFITNNYVGEIGELYGGDVEELI